VASYRQQAKVASMSGILTCSRGSALRRVTTGCEVVKGGAARRGLWREPAAYVLASTLRCPADGRQPPKTAILNTEMVGGPGFEPGRHGPEPL
jgi:hypothetical protein